MSDGSRPTYGQEVLSFWTNEVARDALVVVNSSEHPETLAVMLRSSILLGKETLLLSSALPAFADEEYVSDGLDARYRKQVPTLLEEIGMAEESGALRVFGAEHTFYVPRMSAHLGAVFGLHGRVMWDSDALFWVSRVVGTALDPTDAEPRRQSALAQASVMLTLRYVNHAFPGIESWPMGLILAWRSAVSSSLDAFRSRVSELSAEAQNVATDEDVDLFLASAVQLLDREYEDLARRVASNTLWNRLKDDVAGVSGVTIAALAVST